MSKPTPPTATPPAAPAARAAATVTIEAFGRRADEARDHVVKVVVELRPSEPRETGAQSAASAARRALEACTAAPGQYREVMGKHRGKAGVVTELVVAVEGSVVSASRPADESIEALRSLLAREGYRVAMRERRECEEPSCSCDVVMDWQRPRLTPAGWFGLDICGRHGYRRCATCASIYRMTSDNAAGQAAAVHCEVCGTVLIEWGSSKVWSAELVTRGAAPVTPGGR